MPHVIVKLWPGRSEEQKTRLAEAITNDLMTILGNSDASISVAIQEVPREAWVEAVYEPDIANGPGTLYKKPGYDATTI